ncbi:MAG: protein BatD [Deltaproteobacteria bacterium]|nr:protein BatD [Deltaproteobacteria bacterium]
MQHRRIDAKVRTIPWNQIIIVGTCVMFTVCALILFAGGAQGKGDVGDITILVEPQQIKLGDAAVLAVHITGESSGRPSIPSVEGLRIVPMGQSSQYQSINGKVSAIASYLFQVEPEREGEFNLPPVTARVNGQVKKSEPARLRVSGGGSGSRGLKPRASLPPPVLRATGPEEHENLSADEKNNVAFLRVAPLKYRAYVGELVPVEIRAFFRQGLQASLNSFPVFTGDAFACHELSNKPDQTEAVIDGVPYTVLTWHTAMSAVKEGEHPVSAELGATLLVPQASRRPHPFGRGFFDDDFFNSFFSNAREETVKLTSARKTMRVLPLPKAGRPENFCGAVGQFRLRASASPKSGMVGDPITLKITVKGTGNFDRVSSPILDASNGWRTYTPTTAFKPSDSAGYEGKKSFEQAIIPLHASIDKIPPLVFSYFDTAKKRYVTLRTQPIPMKIVPESKQARASTSRNTEPGDTFSKTSDATAPNKKSTGLAPIHVGLGPVAASLTPIFENPWFVGAQGIPLGALFVGLFLGRRNRRLSNDPASLRKKEVKRNIGRSVREMDRAVAGHDVQGFFDACRRAAQERLGEVWCQAPESITLAEIKNRLRENSEGIRHVFENADAVAYSGRTFSQEELKACRDLVIQELKNLGV